MFSKTPVSMLLVVWMLGIILFFNMFLGPFTKQLQSVKTVTSQVKSASKSLDNDSETLVNSKSEDYIDYSPLAVFDNLLKNYNK